MSARTKWVGSWSVTESEVMESVAVEGERVERCVRKGVSVDEC